MLAWRSRLAILVAILAIAAPPACPSESPSTPHVGQDTTPWRTVLEALSLAMEEHRTARTAPDAGFRRPFVTVTYAQALDGSIADQASRPLPLSSKESFNMTHHLRAFHSSILVGVQTLINDDPSLTVRLCEGSNPQTVVLDSSLRTPLDSRLASSPSCVRPIVATSPLPPHPSPQSRRARSLEAKGCSVMPCAVDASGRLSWDSVLRGLAERGVKSVMVEGGARVISSLLEQGVADYAIVTVSPVYVGGLRCYGSPPTAQPPPAWARILSLVKACAGALRRLVGKGGGRPRGEGVGAKERTFPHILDAKFASVGGDVVLFGGVGRKVVA